MQKNLVIIFLSFIILVGGFFIYIAENQHQENFVLTPTPPPSPQATNPPPPQAGGPSPAPVPIPAPLDEIVWGDRSKKQVILTFDGGSGTHSASKILEVLKNHNVTGTFFLTGKWSQENPEIVKKISQEGHEIFNHTYSHPDLTTISDAQIIQEFSKTEEIIKNLTGKTTKPYFRPPYGARNLHVREILAKEGYQSIYWTVDALDWKEELGFTAEETKERVFSNLKPGTIYMFHIGDNITGNILDEVITKFKKEGYAIVPLSQGI